MLSKPLPVDSYNATAIPLNPAEPTGLGYLFTRAALAASMSCMVCHLQMANHSPIEEHCSLGRPFVKWKESALEAAQQ